MNNGSADRVLVLGAGGYVGREIVLGAADLDDIDVTPMVRPGSRTVPGAVALENAAGLDDVLAAEISGDTPRYDQIVCLPQLTKPGVDWILDRIDGPRWLVFSSAQLDASHDAPGGDVARARERLAVARGAVVIRPTMIYGRGGDQNITRVVRQLQRTRVPVEIGDGSNLVQPIHVDDVVALVHAHRTSGVRPGIHPAGGSEALPAGELMQMVHELLGVRLRPVRVPVPVLSKAARFGSVVGLRPDQIERLVEDKTVDDMATRLSFGWRPAPLAHRVEQAVVEAIDPTTEHVPRSSARHQASMARPAASTVS